MPDGVWQTLVQQNRKGKVPLRFATKQQADRVAWRIIKDWIEAQMAIVEAGIVSLDQVMLPYMQVGAESLYDALKGDHDQVRLGPGRSGSPLCEVRAPAPWRATERRHYLRRADETRGCRRRPRRLLQLLRAGA